MPDFRLIDYLVAILSTEKSPALNGKLNNSQQLKQDLADLGVFDTKMSLYLFDKLREYDNMGFPVLRDATTVCLTVLCRT